MAPSDRRDERRAVWPVPSIALAALAAFACGDLRQPPYTRLQGRAPVEWERRGPALVVFWATWCPPCVEELPGLRALARDPPAGIAVVTVAQDEAATLQRFFAGAPPPDLGLIRDEGHALAGAFGVAELPAAFLVVDGELRARFSGPREWSSRGMRRLLGRLAVEPSSASPPGTRPAR
jgi:thiol-disulfide isomerase/thioredoxin